VQVPTPIQALGLVFVLAASACAKSTPSPTVTPDVADVVAVPDATQDSTVLDAAVDAGGAVDVVAPDADAVTDGAPSPDAVVGVDADADTSPAPDAAADAVADSDSLSDSVADGDAAPIEYGDIPPPDIDLPDFGPYACGTQEGLELFKTKVEPIVFGSQPKTCNQCHLSGIDLSMWVQDTPCQTMACLMSNELVDFETPIDSKILGMIQMAEPESGLITTDVINTEYVAFLEWISYSAQCHSTECGEIASPCSGNTGDVPVPEEVISPLGLACTDEALVQLFHDKVYETWKGRCHGCHSKCDDPDWVAPCWLVEDVDTEDPLAMYQGALVSMYNLIGINAVDYDNPLQSMMILKPLHESVGGVYHGGGAKFVNKADEAYQDFALFVEQYSACYHAETYQKPVVTMVEPNKFNKKFYADQPVGLEGYADDPQDGAIEGGNLIWWSELVPEPLGFGPGPIEVMLPVGKQIITLAAYDSEGNEGTRKLTILVKTPPEP